MSEFISRNTGYSGLTDALNTTEQSTDTFTRDFLARAGLVHCDILPFLSLFHGLLLQVPGQICHHLHLLILKAPALEAASPCSSSDKKKTHHTTSCLFSSTLLEKNWMYV